jgi:hypothetical protein
LANAAAEPAPIDFVIMPKLEGRPTQPLAEQPQAAE